MLVQSLRLQHKQGYSRKFVLHMQNTIQNRVLPLLVDIGGKPQDEQFHILSACTHVILLQRTPNEQEYWHKILEPMNLVLVADLHSQLKTEERIDQLHPYLRGVISGLEREATARRTGVSFGALLDRVAGIFRMDAAMIESEHISRALLPPLLERKLAAMLDVPRAGEQYLWQPESLTRLAAQVQSAQAAALYGRGPVWLAAMLGVHALPSPFALFDIRYGWVLAVPIETTAPYTLEPHCVYWKNYDASWVEFSIVNEVLKEEAIHIPPLGGKGGLVLSGKLPRWAFAALARHFAPQRAWLGVDDPGAGSVVVIYSHIPSISLGSVLSRPSSADLMNY